ncbi:MAG: Smr/MutS family protein [Bacteroidales bacterium]|nr:Smr/MutS family protein [Bacteroidales bacterium]
MIYPHSFEEKIGMKDIREMLRKNCLSALGEQRVEELCFATDAALISEWLRQVGEFVRLEEAHSDFPDQGYYDLRPALHHIRIEGTYMEVDEMFALKRSLETIAGIVEQLQPAREERDEAMTEEDGNAGKGGATEAVPYPALTRMVAMRLSGKSPHGKPVAHDEGTEPLVAHSASLYPALIRRINQILDKFGKVKDSASPELSDIRRELASAEGSVSRVLNHILRNAQAEGTVAQDVAPTMRDGRLVIPVAPALKRKIKGIVHDESATGKTVFIEPQEVVEANNRIRELEADERREIIRILREFTEQVRPQVPQLLQSYEMLADVEFVRAKAHMAREMKAFTTTQPQIAAYPLIDWTLAVHPLLQRTLAKHGKKVVPLEIELTRRQRILLISGPNAGGKSVCLKTVGLLQYMLQCGLPITVGERSQLGVFEHIMIDIGDEQSIEDELSTYSSHLLNMKQMMRGADPATLLLIDEFGGGTEPQIGGAIAEAVLKRFVEKGAFGIITTHYQNLKHFADETEGVVNGAMLYDRHLMQALFQLQIGQPGSSFAVEIARKIGIPEEVINDASDIVGRDYINADKWLQDIVRDRRYWQQKRETIHSREKQMEQTIARYEQEIAELRQQRKDIIRKAKDEAEQLLLDSNARIERTIREIREAQADKEETRRARQQLEDFRIKEVESQQGIEDDAIARKMEKIKRRQERKKQGGATQAEGGTSGATPTSKPTSSPRSSGGLGEGSVVRIKGQTSVGTIERIDGKTATVVFGQMRTTVDLKRLVPATAPQKEESHTGISFLGRETQNAMREKGLHFKQEIDVRGMRGDEALFAVQHYIDDATQVGVAHVRILHGTGTGALRQLIRQYLKTVTSVADARDEHVQFGGAGVTIVEFV